MLIKDIFAADVTRNIAPVVYFHEQDAAKVLEEVSEYIITGGYPETDPRHTWVKFGIHEQFVKLLRGLAEELPLNRESAATITRGYSRCVWSLVRQP